MMAPSDGVRRRTREEHGADGTCVGVRDCRGLRLKLSRWVLTSGLVGVWAAGWRLSGEAERQTSSSSLSERRSERVELQSDTDDKDNRV